MAVLPGPEYSRLNGDFILDYLPGFIGTGGGSLRQSAASLAWGLATLFAGVYFSWRRQPARLIVIWLLGLASISALPFTPTWEGAGLYALPFQPLLVIFCLVKGCYWRVLSSCSAPSSGSVRR
jgi:hypothetical protein